MSFYCDICHRHHDDTLIEMIKALHEDVKHIKKELRTMALSQADFDAKLANFQTTLNAGLTTIKTALADLLAKANSQGVDLTTEGAALDAMLTGIQDAVTTATTDDPGSAPAPTV